MGEYCTYTMPLMKHQILLYYKYVEIDDPEQLMREQRALCERLGLKGRIIVAHEGINGTVEGTVENTEAYIAAMVADPRFADIHWKKSEGTGEAFPKLSVKARKEIVSLHLGEKDFSPTAVTGKRLSPEELQSWYENKEDFVIVDMRNDYELEVGKFANTVFPGMKNFRDLPQQLKEIADLKDKKVLTVCTGGVRCEKASGFLVKEGFNDVYQLDGGIVSYMEKFPAQAFKGSLYVFDTRIVMDFDGPEKHEVIGRCKLCDAPCEQYVNCANNACHLHFVCCDGCREQGQYAGKAICSGKCRAALKRQETRAFIRGLWNKLVPAKKGQFRKKSAR